MRKFYIRNRSKYLTMFDFIRCMLNCIEFFFFQNWFLFFFSFNTQHEIYMSFFLNDCRSVFLFQIDVLIRNNFVFDWTRILIIIFLHMTVSVFFADKTIYSFAKHFVWKISDSKKCLHNEQIIFRNYFRLSQFWFCTFSSRKKWIIWRCCFLKIRWIDRDN